MKKKMILMLIMVLTPFLLSAQKMEYDVIATVQRDMKTLDYGKVSPVEMKIVKSGNSSVSISDKLYQVITVDRNIQEDSIQSVQYTVSDSAGQEYVIKINHDIYNKVDLMKYQVIFFEASHPYDWTYYFTKQPRKAE